MITKKDLAAAISKKLEGEERLSNINRNDLCKIITLVFDEITENLKQNEVVSIHNFAKFSVVEKGETKGFNPATREPITIPARKVVKTSVSSALTEAIK